MTSWREGVSEQTQEDLDGLLAFTSGLAEMSLCKRGEFAPFGAVVGTDGRQAIVMAMPPGEVPPSGELSGTALIDELYAGHRQTRDENRACAIAADATVDGSDAITVRLEHRDGIALQVALPYRLTRRLFRKRTIEYGDGSAAALDRRVWTDAGEPSGSG